MDYGLVLPTMHAGASAEGIEAAAEVAERVGWSDVWTTDHVLIEHDSADEYGLIYEAILALAHVGARHPTLKLGTSVIVVPQRQSVVLAKELATLDALSRGRVIAGVGIGWDRVEFGNLGMADRFAVRGAYLDETVRLWRHLWGGATGSFHGRFHHIDDFVFEPLPPQGAELPVWFGGRAPAALERAGRLGDGYHSSSTSPATYAERIPAIQASADGRRSSDADAVGAGPRRPRARSGRCLRLRPARHPGRDARRDRRVGRDRRDPPGPLLRVGHPRGDRPRRGLVRTRRSRAEAQA